MRSVHGAMLWSLMASGLLALAPSAQAADEGKPPPEQEQAFADKMSGAVLTGTWTIEGRDGLPPKPERYTIVKVSKLQGDLWLFQSRIEYGGKDVTIPVPLKVLWAGETPTIQLTETTLPGLGTFSSRILIDGTRYAGTWQHDQVGGHMWGTIEPGNAEKTEKADPATEASAN